MPITIRKFNEGETLGDALKAVRLAIPRTLSEMAAVTRIQKSLLEALEKNDRTRLPEACYAKQFLKTYVKALGGDETYFLQRFEEDHGSCDVALAARLPIQRVSTGSKLTPVALLRNLGLAVGALSVVAYLGLQVRAITAAPPITLADPRDGSVTQDAIVHVRGTTDTKADVKINGNGVLLRRDGTFEADVALERGLNVITVESAKRYSRSATLERRVILQQDQKAAAGSLPLSGTN